MSSGSETAGVESNVPGRATHKRYDWLDQARGLVALFFTISVITSPLCGRVLLGTYQLGPTYLDHGYAYYKGYPALITIMDIGQLNFMFLLGFAAYIAFTSRLKRKGTLSAWLYAARRVGALYALSFGSAGILNIVLRGRPINWPEVFYNDILAELALGALASYVTIYFIRNADKRMFLCLAVFTVHAFLFAAYVIDRYPWWDDMIHLPKFPLGALNLMPVAVTGTVFAQWLRTEHPDMRVTFRRRVVPTSSALILAAYFMEWLQHSEHHDVTTALALLSVGLSGLLLTSTYAFSELGFEIPLLSTLGKNLILIFIVGGLGIIEYVKLFPREFLASHPFATLFLIGFLPLAVVCGIAIALEKWNIVIRL